MEFRTEMQETLQEYDQAVQELQKKRKWLDGVFGFGNHPGNAACHEVLDQKVETLCQAAAEASEAEIAELMDLIFRAEEKWQGPDYARLSLIALQRHTIPLIPRLAREDRERLRAWYEKRYPRRARLPVQEQVMKLLSAK